MDLIGLPEERSPLFRISLGDNPGNWHQVLRSDFRSLWYRSRSEEKTLLTGRMVDDEFLFDVASAPCDIEIKHHKVDPRIPGPAWILAHVITGNVMIEQGSHTVVLGPGDLGICGMEREISLHTAAQARLSLISLFREPLGASVTRADRSPLRTIIGRPGISNATASLLRTVTADLAQFSDESIRTAHRSIRMLLFSALDEFLDEETRAEGHRRDLAEVVRKFIVHNLPNASLTPAMIAGHFHISLRQLHRVFEEEERGVAHEILNLRIKRCARDLRDPAHRHENVSAIAARWGITDASKFSRQFRSVLGMSPREYRAGAGHKVA